VGKHLFMELVKKSDVVLENFSTGTMERLGIGYSKSFFSPRYLTFIPAKRYNTLKEVNPGIIYASITGFGQTGPYSSRPGYDIIAQALLSFGIIVVGAHNNTFIGDEWIDEYHRMARFSSNTRWYGSR